MKRLTVLVLLAVFALGASGALAAKPPTETNMALTYEARTGPSPDCIGEDTWWSRRWAGSLGGAFSVTVETCSSPGGEGIAFGASGNGSWNLYAMSPSGLRVDSVAHSSRGNWQAWWGCAMPPTVAPFGSGWIIIGTIESGIWTVVVEGVARDLNLSVEANMAHPSWQRIACPAEYRSDGV